MRYELRVNRAELKDGLNRLRKGVKKKKRPQASISFTGADVVISLDGVEVLASAAGDFPGVAAIPGLQARNLGEALPPEDPLTIVYENHRLYLGSLSLPCSWEMTDETS